MKSRLISLSLSSLFILSAGTMAGVTYGAGFQINEMSPSLQATALAGAASATNDVTAISFNPATLASLKHSQLYAGGSLIMPHINVSNARATTDNLEVAGITQQNNIAPNAFVPDFYAAWVAAPRVKVGLAVTAPWGLTTEYARNWVGRGNALESKIETVDIAPTIAFQVTPNVAFGFAFHAQYAKALYSNDILGATNTLSGDSWGYGFSLGTVIEPWQGTDFGLSFRSKVKQSIAGNDHLAGNLIIVPVDENNPVSAGITMPAVVDISLSQVLSPKWTVMATAQRTFWQSFKVIDAKISNIGDQVTVTNWDNAWLLSLGSSYKINPQWTFKEGLAFDQTPTIDATRDPRIPGSDRYWLTLGFTFSPNRHTSIDAVYEHIFMQNQNITDSQQKYLSAIVDSVSADYSGSADIIALGLRYSF